MTMMVVSLTAEDSAVKVLRAVSEPSIIRPLFGLVQLDSAFFTFFTFN